ncbi:hypothetical protein [Alkalicoccobacillus plakortidis]|uniref:Coat F domain-containing protein n=1 Tax=Alkalicoccobacillus plakortidis TaxID=444060 RepID=A0ABT0XID7_9BACI|nr:hypothetical protein [Alkalicoccobacillus plakortidis]MCM2675525.1 hypothetical protein [Alkalicoccobacillus plakortidis]
MQQQQGTQANQQQNFISEPPQVISTKDHLYINDMLSWNLLAMKKAYFYASNCQDAEIKEAINQAGQMHKRHYERLLTHLKPTTEQPTVQ